MKRDIIRLGCDCNTAKFAIVGWDNEYGSGILAWTNNEFHAQKIKKDIINHGGKCRIDNISNYDNVNDYLTNMKGHLLDLILT